MRSQVFVYYFLLGICGCLTTHAKYPVENKVQKGVWGYCQKRYVCIFSLCNQHHSLCCFLQKMVPTFVFCMHPQYITHGCPSQGRVVLFCFWRKVCPCWSCILWLLHIRYQCRYSEKTWALRSVHRQLSCRIFWDKCLKHVTNFGSTRGNSVC